MQDDLTPIKQKFQETFVRVWNREAENDGFNRLVIAAELEWYEVVVLRAYSKYIRQIGVNVSEQLIQQGVAFFVMRQRVLERERDLLHEAFLSSPDLQYVKNTEGEFAAVNLTMNLTTCSRPWGVLRFE